MKQRNPNVEKVEWRRLFRAVRQAAALPLVIFLGILLAYLCLRGLFFR